eukprot:c17002_g1_i1 orf=250-1095(+)
MAGPTRFGALTGGVVGIGVCVVAAVVGIFIQEQCGTPCACPSISGEERCQLIPLFMKVPLIATHLIPFILMPFSMWVCHEGTQALQEMGAKSPFQALLGLAYIMVSISGEVGWHVHQRWFYHEDYDILNFFHYVFITLGTTFWALGVQTKDTQSNILDALLMLCTPLATLTYGRAAYLSYHEMDGATKVPIHIAMCYQYAVLSWRLFKLLKGDMRVWIFPFFSVGMNLFFVILLQKYQINLILNPLFHILHDVAGTMMGVLIITLLLWSATSNNSQAKKTL